MLGIKVMFPIMQFRKGGGDLKGNKKLQLNGDSIFANPSM